MTPRAASVLLSALVLAVCGPAADEAPSAVIPAPPYIELSPTFLPATRPNSEVQVTGRVRATVALSALGWRLNTDAEQPLPLAPGTTSQEFSFRVSVPWGESVLRLKAADEAGQVVTSELRLNRGDAGVPWLKVLSPTEGLAVATRRVRVEAVVDDDTGVKSLGYVLNGGEPRELEVMPDAVGAFSFEVTPRPGANLLVLRAQDGYGKTGETSVTFHFGERTAAGAMHTGLLSRGALYTWGHNSQGQLGLGEAGGTEQRTPQRVPGLEGVVSLAFGGNSSLAITKDGTVWTWGGNDDGQLGLGDRTPRSRPTRIEALSGAVAASLGERHALVLMEDGTVRAFGESLHGQLGDGTITSSRESPVPVTGLTDVVKVAASGFQSLALKADGTVWAWGDNSHGQLGTGPGHVFQSTPAQVPILSDVVDIAAGVEHFLALHADGTVSAWGYGGFGQLGVGAPSGEGPRPSPVKVRGLSDARAVFAGPFSSYALRAHGSLVAWGMNASGQLGTGNTSEAAVPVPAAPGLYGLVGLAPGARHAVALRNDGAVFTWGWNTRGSLGRADLGEGASLPSPVEVVMP